MSVRALIIVIYVIILSSCGTPDQLKDTTLPVIPNHRYEAERISLLPPLGEGWKVIYFQENGSISFGSGAFSYKEGVRNNDISVRPFQYYLNANDFEGLLQSEIEKAEKDQAKFDHANTPKGKSWRHIAGVISKAGMRCVFREEFTPVTSVSGKNLQIRYFCEQPNQPKDFPPIQITFNESALPEVEFSDPDIVLAPIWNSLQFKPVDRSTSVAYQNWKVKNAEFRERQRQLEEKVKLKNATKK